MPIKLETLREAKGNRNVFLETGTHVGGGCRLAHQAGFTDIRSCEPYPPLYKMASKLMDELPHCEIYEQISKEFLMEQIPTVSSAVIYLDAHSSGEGTFRGIDPIYEEADVIAKFWESKDLVVCIDDCRGRFKTIENIAEQFGNCELTYHSDSFDPQDVAVLRKK